MKHAKYRARREICLKVLQVDPGRGVSLSSFKSAHRAAYRSTSYFTLLPWHQLRHGFVTVWDSGQLGGTPVSGGTDRSLSNQMCPGTQVPCRRNLETRVGIPRRPTECNWKILVVRS
eukprot:2988328-Rhodomonas_salina.1